jgi:ABC-type multidrug transport system fused ATPase/permease subunit
VEDGGERGPDDACSGVQPVPMLYPRRLVWLHQLGAAAAAATYAATQLTGAAWPAALGVVMTYLAALVHDTADKLRDGDRRRRLRWLPVYVCNAVYALLATANALFADGDGGATAAAAVAATAPAVAAVLAVVGCAHAATVAGTPQRGPPTTEYTCGLYAYTTFSYLNELVAVAMKKESLELEDVPHLSDADTCACVHAAVADPALAGTSLAYRLFHLVRGELYEQTLFQVAGSVLGFLSPLALRAILLEVNTAGANGGGSDGAGTPSASDAADAADSKGLGILALNVNVAIAVLFFSPILGSLANGMNYQRGRRMAVRVGAAMLGLLYRKSLTVDLSAIKEGAGSVNNLISVDMKEVQDFVTYVQFLWSTVFEGAICLTLLFLILGPAALGGVAVLLVASPVGAYGTKKVDDYQTALLKDKDERIGVVQVRRRPLFFLIKFRCHTSPPLLSLWQEVIHGVRILKCFAWADRFLDKISAARQRELSSLRNYLLADALLKINWGLVPTLVGLCSFLLHTAVLGRPLSPAVGFSSILLFNLLRWPITIFPDMVNSLVRARVSLRRIEAYLRVPDVVGLATDAAGAGAPEKGEDGDVGLVLEAPDAGAAPANGAAPSAAVTAAAAIVLTDASYGWKLPSRDDPLDVEGEGKGSGKGIRRKQVSERASAVNTFWSTDVSRCLAFLYFVWQGGAWWGKAGLGLGRPSAAQQRFSLQRRPSLQVTLPFRHAQRTHADPRLTGPAFPSSLPPSLHTPQSVSSLNDEEDDEAGEGAAGGKGHYSFLASSSSHGATNGRVLSAGRRNGTGTGTRTDATSSEHDDDEETEVVFNPRVHAAAAAREEADEDEEEGAEDAGGGTVTVLRGLSLRIPAGSLTAVCGSTGAGKSTLLAGLLGECQQLGGSTAVAGRVSYVSQSAWIQNATLRQNILFGRPYDEERYSAVVRRDSPPRPG